MSLKYKNSQGEWVQIPIPSDNKKLNKPEIDGTNGQILSIENGETKWINGARVLFTPSSQIININEFAREPQGYDVMEAFTLVNDTYDEATGSGAHIDIPKGALIVTETTYNSRLKKWVLHAFTVNSNRGDFVLLDDTINSDNWGSEYTPVLSEIYKGFIDLNLHSTPDTRLQLDNDIVEDGEYILNGKGYIGISTNSDESKMVYIAGNGITRLLLNSEAGLATIIGDNNYVIEYQNVASDYDWRKTKLLTDKSIEDKGYLTLDTLPIYNPNNGGVE